MSFERDVRRIADRMQVKAEEVVQNVIWEVFGGTVRDTPVETGRLQGNWQCTINIPATGSVEAFGAGGPLSDIYATVKGPGLYYLTNNLPYAERIEFDGWSHTKAPQGMVRKNARRVRAILAKEARKV